MERYTLEDYEAYRKEQDGKAAKEEEARNARMEKEAARKAWIRDGGSAADFERDWPRLRDEGRRQRVIDADRRARELQRNGTTSGIYEGKLWQHDEALSKRSAARTWRPSRRPSQSSKALPTNT
jgi:hypothetical protein